jgi:hypothetical protein
LEDKREKLNDSLQVMLEDLKSVKTSFIATQKKKSQKVNFSSIMQPKSPIKFPRIINKSV